VTLTDAEQQYFSEIQRGSLRFDLLFRDDAAGAQLAAHPALTWKLANVRTHLERRRARTDT
jgi:hypothetical protein